MDLTIGDTSGRDALRTALGSSAALDDGDLQDAWDAMCDHALWEVRPEYLESCPPSVVDWAMDVAAAIHRKRTGGGDMGVAPGETFGGPAPFSIRRHRATLGNYATPHRTVV